MKKQHYTAEIPVSNPYNFAGLPGGKMVGICCVENNRYSLLSNPAVSQTGVFTAVIVSAKVGIMC